MKLSSVILRHFLYFLIFGTHKIPKILYISGNENPQKPLIFQEKELFSSSSKNKKNPPEKIYYIPGNGTF